MICSWVDTLPQRSVTSQRRCKVYSEEHAPSKRTSVPSETVTSSPQLSSAEMDSGPAMAGTLSHSTVMSAGPSRMAGGVVSSRETVNSSEKKRPQSESNARMLNVTLSVHAPVPEGVHSSKSQTKSPDKPSMASPLMTPSHLNQPPKPFSQLWLLAPMPYWKRLFKETGMCSNSRYPSKSPPPINTDGEAMLKTMSSSSLTSQSWKPS